MSVGKVFNRVIKNLAPIKKISVSAWADKYRQLPSTSSEPGRWRTMRTPYLKEIMDAFTQENIHQVIAMTSSQVGKSEALNNVIGRFMHLDPCTILMVQPSQQLAEKYSKTRIMPMFRDTKVLTELFNERNQTILEKYFIGGQLLMVGSNSPANLASQPVRIVLCDEVDRFQIDLNGEGDPVKLATARTTTFWNYKIGLFSTPTVKNHSRIEQAFKTGTQEFWSYKCLNCGEFHELNFRNFVKVEGEIKFRCPDCGFEFFEREIKNSEQKYIAKNPAALEEGIRSFCVNAFSSPWLSWKKIFEEFEEAKGKPSLEKVIYNTRFAESYELRGAGDENEFLKNREKYIAEIPSSVLLLTAAVDVQNNRLEYEVAGWGRGEVRFGILRGIIPGSPTIPETWIELDKILDREYKFSSGKALKITRTFIDSGFATKNVYDYCGKNLYKGRIAIKGKGGPGLPLIYQFHTEKNFGIPLVILGVNDGKQEIFSRLSIKNGGDFSMRFPLDDNFFNRRGYDEIYFTQLFSERQTLKRSGGVAYLTFEPIRSDIRNESLDLAVYNFAAFKSLNVDFDYLDAEINGATITIPKKNKVRKKNSSTIADIF